MGRRGQKGVRVRLGWQGVGGQGAGGVGGSLWGQHDHL